MKATYPTAMDQTKSLEDRYQLQTYAKWPVCIERGLGCYVYDSQGREYLDFYAGHAVVSTGHCHPHVVQAIQEQAGRLIFYSNAGYNTTRARAVAKLLEMAGTPYHQVFLANSGSEANENAIKLARALTGRREMISMTGSFHGRSYGSLSSTGIAKYSSYLNTPVPMHRILPADQVARNISPHTAGVLVEPIQSLGGVHEIATAILKEIQEACQEHGALLIYDEVQTGIGRTGSFLYAGRAGTYPDMVTLAKGIASGFPAGALLLTEPLARQVKAGDLGTTFGGGPLACAALEATLEVIQKERLAGHAAEIGDHLKKQLSGREGVVEVRGRGLLLGLQLKEEAKKVQQALWERSILTGTSDDPHVLRLMPPLVLTHQQAEQFLEAFLTVGVQP